MTFSFSSLLTTAESAISTIATEAAPLEQAAGAIAPIVEALVPSTEPVITAVEAGAASITALAPNAIQDVTAVISDGKKLLSNLTPEMTQLEATFDKLFNITTAGQSILLTPKTTAATVPAATAAPLAAAPGKALS